MAAAAAVVALLPALAGCGGKSSAMGGSEPAGQVLHVAQTAEPTTLDPAQVQDGPTIELMMQVYDGLVQWDTKNHLVPALATKWEVGNGGRTYTFHIRPGVHFQNGRELTARDFQYSLTRSLDPKLPPRASPVAMTYLNDLVGAKEFNDGKAASVKGIEVPDDHTLRLTIDRPKAYFLAKLTYPTAYAVCREEIEKTGGAVDEHSMIGTGPFKLAEYVRGDRILLDANPSYFEGAPKLAHVERRIILNDGTRHDKFDAGELDITDVTMAEYRADKQNPKLSPLIHVFQRPSVYYLALNQKAYPPFKDRRVRRAFAMAVDKQQIVSTVLEGLPPVANGILPIGIPGYDASFKGLPYDPGQAQSLLAQAGYPNGQGLPPLTLSFRAQVEDIRNTVQAAAADLQKNLGVTIQLDETEWTTFLKRRNDGTMPFYFLRWAADYLDPQDFLSVMLRTGTPENTLGYSNPEFDRLCDQADGMQDAAARLAAYRKAESLAVEDAPWVPIYFQKDAELWNPKLRGVEDSLMGHLPHKRTYFAP